MSSFPQLNMPFVDKSGNITTPWMRLLQQMWLNQGGASGSLAAPAAGNANQQFNVATATSNSNAVPLAQADSRYAPVAGNQTQSFQVGNAAAGSNQAIRRSQVEALFPSFAGAGAAIVPITVTASPFTYTATTGGEVAISGGTITSVQITRGASTITVGTGNISVRNGDAVKVTYTAAPTMNFLPL